MATLFSVVMSQMLLPQALDNTLFSLAQWTVCLESVNNWIWQQYSSLFEHLRLTGPVWVGVTEKGDQISNIFCKLLKSDWILGI